MAVCPMGAQHKRLMSWRQAFLPDLVNMSSIIFSIGHSEIQACFSLWIVLLAGIHSELPMTSHLVLPFVQHELERERGGEEGRKIMRGSKEGSGAKRVGAAPPGNSSDRQPLVDTEPGKLLAGARGDALGFHQQQR